MPITLGFFASIFLILPGLVGLVFFNAKAGRAGVRRPEQPLTAVSSLVTAFCVALFVHYLAFLLFEGGVHLASEIHRAEPKIDLGPIMPNPLGEFVLALAADRPMDEDAGLALALIVILELAFIISFLGSRAFELLVEPLDLGGHGWVFQHITRPAENGYTPIAHVFTKMVSGDYGIAYKGPVIDIRQASDGQILSVALGRPERFLFHLRGIEARQEAISVKAGKRNLLTIGPEPHPMIESQDTGFRTLEKEPVGGAIAFDGPDVWNIVVHSVSNEILDRESEGEA